MSAVICTLFEGNYHFGLAALTNSLHSQGFRGEIYAGYRGALPPWASTVSDDIAHEWPGAKTYQVAEGVHIHFLPVDTYFHFTNYKPTFMLQLWAGPAKQADAIAYFDPDIVINCSWSFYENWISHGVALVHEIVVNDMPSSHPVRMEWKKIIEKSNRTINHNVISYINGGFCGVAKENNEFLEIWQEFIKTGVEDYKADIKKICSFNKTSPFCFLDQDALNIAAMCSKAPLSEIGPEGMDFVPGGWTMAHAVGSPKPWNKKFIQFALGGSPPTIADKQFWKNIKGAIDIYDSQYAKIKVYSLYLAALVGRFYRKH